MCLYFDLICGDTFHRYTMVPDVLHEDPDVPQYVLPAVMHKARTSHLPPMLWSAPNAFYSFRKLGLLRHSHVSTLIR